MDDIYLEGVVEPDDFITGEHIGVFDFSACGVWRSVAISSFPAQYFTVFVFDQVFRLAVQGVLEFLIV